MSMIIDGTNGLTFNNSTTQTSGGKIIQFVASTPLTASFSTSSSTYVATGLTLSITPLFSTSKILLICSGGTADNNGTTGQQVNATIYKNGSNIASSNGLMLAYGSVSRVQTPISISYIDSPASTSAITYAVYASNSNTSGTIYFNNGASTTQFFAMEIAA